jgi:drug/metabolite transporter (DMT)-like permease
MVIGLCTFPFGWIIPSIKDLVLLIIMGMCGSIANLLLTQSYRLAEASLVTPIKYLSLIYAITFGFIIWGEVPKPLMLAGSSLVVLSSLIIFIREKKLKKKIVIPRS